MKRLLCIGVSLLLVTIFLAIPGNAQHDVAVGDSSNIILLLNSPIISWGKRIITVVLYTIKPILETMYITVA